MDRERNEINADVRIRSGELLQEIMVGAETLRAAVFQVRRDLKGQHVKRAVSALKATEAGLGRAIDQMSARFSEVTGLSLEQLSKITACIEAPSYPLAHTETGGEWLWLADQFSHLIVSTRIAREEIDLSGDHQTATQLATVVAGLREALIVIEGFLPPSFSAN